METGFESHGDQDVDKTLDLLNLASEGDGEAFQQLFDAHRSTLRRMLELRMDYKMRHRMDESDILQEAQMTALKKLGEYLERRPMPFHLWLRKTTHECMLQNRRYHVEAQKRSVDREVPLPDRSSIMLARAMFGGRTPSEEMVRRELVERVQLAVSRLDEGDREVLVMRNLEGMSNQEVSVMLDVTPEAASKRYGRALLRLRTLLIREGITPSQLA